MSNARKARDTESYLLPQPLPLSTFRCSIVQLSDDQPVLKIYPLPLQSCHVFALNLGYLLCIQPMLSSNRLVFVFNQVYFQHQSIFVLEVILQRMKFAIPLCHLLLRLAVLSLSPLR